MLPNLSDSLIILAATVACLAVIAVGQQDAEQLDDRAIVLVAR